MDHEEETINPLYSGRPAFAVRHPSWLALHRRDPGSRPPTVQTVDIFVALILTLLKSHTADYHLRSNLFSNHPLYGTFGA